MTVHPHLERRGSMTYVGSAYNKKGKREGKVLAGKEYVVGLRHDCCQDRQSAPLLELTNMPKWFMSSRVMNWGPQPTVLVGGRGSHLASSRLARVVHNWTVNHELTQTYRGSGILASMVYSVVIRRLQGWYVLTIPSKLTNDSKKKGER